MSPRRGDTTAASILATFTELNLLSWPEHNLIPSLLSPSLSPSTFQHTTAGQISLRLSGVKGLHVCMFNILELQESSLK